ncbi:MAG: T9SS type A sorting domain-containing protein [Chitinophagaceae bacterium]|nr:T9SS type A sorting domain-containing protein [Chitinophagaceae bacterium]
MRKLYFTTLLLVAAVVVANAQSNRRLTWSRTGNTNVSGTTGGSSNNFLLAASWGGFTPGNNDTLSISGASVTVTGNINLSGLSNIVLELNTPNGATAYTMGITSGNSTVTLSSTSSISLKPNGKIHVAGSGGGNTRQFKIGTAVKLSNFGGSTAYTVNGPANASQSTANASAGAPLLGFSSGTLPVILVSFDAVKQGNSVMVSWKTQQEISTKEFVIEKSADGRNYNSIATVAAAGFSSNPRSYSYTDASSISGIAYYRVRMIDMDGKSGLTGVKAVRAAVNAVKVAVYPNPAVSVANVVVNAPDAAAFNVNVFNRNGQLVGQQKAAAGANMVSINVSAYAAGDYTIDVQFADGSRQSSKLIVGKQ